MTAPPRQRLVPPQRGLVGSQLHVLIADTEVARLSSGRAGQAKLTYLPGADAVTRGLSCCLPVTKTRHSGEPVVNWLAGLLPDRGEVLLRWRAQFQVRRQDAYALLWHVGEDVAGAARFVRPDRLPGHAGATEVLTERQVGDRIRALAADAAAWAPSTATGQFSLAGAQAKFALALVADDQWAQTSGSTPTTHIFKPAIPDMADQDINEHLTMRLAGAAGLAVAPTQVLQFDGARCLVVTRFDRQQTSDGKWRRIHQEDAVQALGKSPQLKYEQNGGPGVRGIAKLLRDHVTGGHSDTDVARFIDAVAFNWLVAGTDAHARNYSLLHTRSATRLAPLYDLNSFLPYANGRQVSLAMKVGFTERDPSRISRRDFEELIRDCHLDAAVTLDRVDALAQRLLAVIGDVVDDPSLHRFASDLPARFGELLVAHVNACRRRL